MVDFENSPYSLTLALVALAAHAQTVVSTSALSLAEKSQELSEPRFISLLQRCVSGLQLRWVPLPIGLWSSQQDLADWANTLSDLSLKALGSAKMGASRAEITGVGALLRS